MVVVVVCVEGKEKARRVETFDSQVRHGYCQFLNFILHTISILDVFLNNAHQQLTFGGLKG